MTRIVGIDPSLTGTGIAIITDGQVALHTLTSKGAAGDTLAQRRLRISRLRRAIEGVIYPGVDLLVIEAPAFSRTAGHMHDRSGLWWMLVDTALSSYVPVAEVTPTTRARYATGKGNASKDAVLLAVARRYPHIEVGNNNEADALVLGAMGARWLGQPIDHLPLAQAEAIAKVAWPGGLAC